MSPAPPAIVYSVDTLTAEVKKLLEMSYVDVWVEGEVSQLASPPSGHLYFTLKDQNSLLKCVLFKNKKYLCTSLPVEGERVLVRGSLSVYTARGDVQLICRYVEGAGEGELRRQFEALKNSLKAEGLFDQAHKMALPVRPRTVALITSSHGAVLHDIISTLSRRYPFVDLKLYPTPVQGDLARDEILAALKAAEQAAPDVIILARGGGSLEDLQVFNDEAIARALYACAIPTVSAIGHETDFVISDFVADLRAPTPTAAATLISPDINETRLALKQYRSSLVRQMQASLDRLQQQLDMSVNGLKHPREKLAMQATELQGLGLRLKATQQGKLDTARRRLEAVRALLRLHSPENHLNRQSYALDRLADRLYQLMKDRLNHEQARLRQHTATLQAFNPVQTLARGYSILQNDQGEIVRSATQVETRENLQIRLYKGKLDLSVTGKTEE